MMTPWRSNLGLLKRLVRRNPVSLPQQHSAITVSPWRRIPKRRTTLWSQKTVTQIFLTDGFFDRISWEKRWLFPCHGLFFCRGFHSGIIDPPFTSCNKELKTLLPLVIVMCHMYNRVSNTTSVLIVCEECRHHVCKHMYIFHFVLNNAVRTNQRSLSLPRSLSLSLSLYGNVSQLNATVLHDMGICTTPNVICYGRASASGSLLAVNTVPCR